MAAKSVLRHLKGTCDFCWSYHLDDEGIKLQGACDAEWVSDIDYRRSTTGYTFRLQRSGAAISWNPKKQPTAAISCSEAEYQAKEAVVQEVLYLRSIVDEKWVECNGPTVIQEDNQSCIKMCKNPAMKKRATQFDIKHYFVRERVEDSSVEMQNCSTEEMC